MSVNKSYKEQIKLIKEDIRKTYDGITRELANQAKKDLVTFAHSIIEDFYNSYQPDVYKRKHNLYNMIVPKTVDKFGSDNGFEASISTMSMAMDDVYNISPDTVYDLMWNQGIRGLPQQGIRTYGRKNYKYHVNYGENDTTISGDVFYNSKFHTFCPYISIYGKTFCNTTPHLTMSDFINSWGDIGTKHLKKIDKKYKSNTYIKF